ncbi:MAG: hypothetical protein HYX93_06055 [Chloroflexi bacterium]|nr:hypothetical protein [Chloroflexota bacterium]
MSELLQAAVGTQGMLTTISAGFNALYFARYSAPSPARRIATLVLSLVNLSFCLQGVYWATLPIHSSGPGSPYLQGEAPLLALGLLPLACSLAISALILRQRFNGRGRD